MGNQVLTNFSASTSQVFTHPTSPVFTHPTSSNPLVAISTEIDYLSLQEKWNSKNIFITDIISSPTNISRLPKSYNFKILPILACDMVLLPSKTKSNHLLLIIFNQACCILIYDILFNNHSTEKPMTDSILSINIFQSLQLPNTPPPKLISINADGKYFIISEDKKTLAVFHKKENSKTFLKKHILNYTKFFRRSNFTSPVMISHCKIIYENILIFTENHQLFIIDYVYDRMLGVFDFNHNNHLIKIQNIDGCIASDNRIIIGVHADCLGIYGISYVSILDISQLIIDYGETSNENYLKLEDYCIQILKTRKNMKFSSNGDYLCCGSSSSDILIYKKIVSKNVSSIGNGEKLGNFFRDLDDISEKKNENVSKNNNDFLMPMVVGKKSFQYLMYRKIRFDAISKTIGYYFEVKMIFIYVSFHVF